MKSTPLKLLIVTHYFPLHGGGVEIVAGQLTDHLLAADSDLKIEWFASNTDVPPPKSGRFAPRPMRTWNAIENKVGVPCPIWSPFELFRLWYAVRRCHIVHLHDYAYFGNICTAVFCRLQNKRYVVTQHIGFVPFQKAWMRLVLEKLNHTVGKWVLNGAEEVIFISDEVRRYFEPILGSREVRLIPNGVDADLFSPVFGDEREALRERIRAELRIDKASEIVLFVGRFVEKKGIPLLLKLAERFPEVNWIFAGRGPLEPEQPAPNVRIVKGKKGRQIAELMNAADLFVLPSVGEGFPLVVQEALACGTAVLAETALANALPEVAGYINVESLGQTDDLERWEQRIRLLLSDDLEKTRSKRAGFAGETWSWKKCAGLYLEILKRKS